MQYHITDSGALRVQMTDEELSSLGIPFAELDAANLPTRRLLRRVLLDAAVEVGFKPTGGVLVEAVPLDGGCLLLLTPRKLPSLPPASPPEVWRFYGIDALLDFQKAAAHRCDKLPLALYRQEMDYYLILYLPAAVPLPLKRLIAELADPAGTGEVAVATVAEHGAPLTFIRADGSVPPVPPGPLP